MYPQQSQQGSSGGHPKRRKKRPIHGLRVVEVTRSKSGYGFTISGQHPCVLSNIVKDSPAEYAGLKAGNYLVAVNNLNIAKAPHDDVVRMVGTSTGTLILQVAESYNSSDSSDEEYHHRTKARYPNRIRQRHGSKHGERVLGECNQREKHNSQEHRHKETHFAKPADTKGAISRSRARLHTPVGAENTVTHSSKDLHQFAGPLPVERRSASQSRSLHVTPVMQRPQAKQAIVKSTTQSAHSSRQMAFMGSKNHYGSVDQNLNGITNAQKSYANNSISSLLKTSVANTSANNAFIVMDDDDGDDEESLLNQSFHETRVVVGYIGSLEMPSDADKPHIRIQSIRNAVRRLRVEQKIHTLVLMEVSADGVKLTNCMGTTVAHYPVDRIAFSGVTPDDKRFFGIVTLHCSNSDETGSEAGSQDESVSSGSCHVFMVDPEIKSHNIHAQKAKSFGITCTPTPDRHHCAEFPKSATPVILCISNLYKDRPGVSNDNELALSQAFTDPSRAPQRTASNSSNSDSGLGFGKEEPGSERVLVVNMPPPPDPPSQNGWHATINNSVHHCSPDNHTIPTPCRNVPKSVSMHGEASNRLNQSTLSEDWGRNKRKINPRAMPDHGPKYNSTDGLERQNSAENLRASMRRLIQQRQRSGSTISSDQESNSSNVSDFQRSFSQPDLQKSSTSAFSKHLPDQSYGSCPNNSKIDNGDVDDDRLSPRAFLPPPFSQLRSPSAPPTFHRDDSFDDIPAAETSGMCSLIERFEQDQAFRISSPVDVSRRYSEGTPKQQKQREKNRTSDDIQDNWAKPQTRTRKLSRLQHPLSHSHESLVALDTETNHRLSTANSVNNITNNGEDDEHEDDIGRIAGWAVNFNKLLNDHGGLAVFTEFLKKEFSQENILFWRTCEQFKHIEDSDKRKGEAKEIFMKYMSQKATDPVNVEHVSVKQVEKQLDNPGTNTFEKPQQEIFKLMKQDSYPRFIKSELYKTYLMREMEGKPLNLPADEFEQKDKKEEKNKSKIESKEKRRRSLLPWRGRSSKQSIKAASDSDLKKMNEKKEKEKEKEKEKITKEKEVNNNTQQRKPSIPAGPGIDLSTMRKEATKVTNENDEQNFKFCRVIMPDGSTTVVCARPGQTIRTVLGKLCDKRSLSIAGVDVFLLGSDKPLDLAEDISTLGSKEVMIERRVLFRMDLPNRKSIGVKAKPNRTIRDVFKPILNKYGFKLDNIFVQLSGKPDVLDIDEQVSTIDNQRVVILQQDDIVDPDSKVKGLLKNNEDRPSLGLFGLRRKESASVKDPPPSKMKSKHKVTFNLQKNQTRTSQGDDDKFLELLSKAQRQRLDDQRGLDMNNSEIPEFLRNKSHHSSGRESAPPILSRDRSEYVQNNDKYSSHNRISSSGRISSMSVEVVDISADDSEYLMSTDQSFSQDGIIPQTSEAQEYFQSSDSINADFDDPCLAEKNLRDLGFDYSYNMYQAKAFGYSRYRPLSPNRQSIERNSAPLTSLDLLDSTTTNDDFDDTLTSSPADHRWRPQSVPPVLVSNKNGVLKQLSPLPYTNNTPTNTSAFCRTSNQKPSTFSTFTSTPKPDNKPVILDLANTEEDVTFV
ncbi:regulator of G-protein signaling 12-like isoform X2 [Mytilus californianus]|uniref:regulator of G-protein signaling 12-like isoform X2 n=1 Tax=Mytilus californianus TaxID=6549 RepID=UPI00224544D1|nr:regulator of G-protein signaling 12-like isoform X2 [Mytilus californianus]